ncbi:Plasmid stabilization system protein [Rubripirellula obstinata]|uniref:Plasmid stabilization system protein n=1 Tax=Rubripirellula obstinata TaxID=406547 RepID=A0A5B1CBZ6_9BACT|nr:type II toxin-antitoxin system RelE/ParE family toxin [Rubripirellula obstinata]KAA1256775.1 Plasmid stabilization system protein [Rubripirellula obstinata]KAA1256844.1 Plasmid stabilization system protein [Rubripirellula obstinata]KAA1257098.1 Plasmid stabilization system protein [Rubripirellula obstinata]
MKLRWTEKATSDLIGVYDYIAQSSPEYAASVSDRIFRRPDPQLIDFPKSGSIVPEYGRDDIREIFSDSYRIIHLVLKHEVRILTVIHGSVTLPVEPPLNG